MNERRKVRLNNKYPKEDASTFTLSVSFSSQIYNVFISSLSFHVLLPLLSVSSHLFISPHGQQFQIQTLLSPFSFCHNFKQRRRSGHADVPGASVTVPSQVYVSQRVLDDTLSLSPVSLLLISVVSSGGSKDSWATFTNYRPARRYLCHRISMLLILLQLGKKKKHNYTWTEPEEWRMSWFSLSKSLDTCSENKSECVFLKVKSPLARAGTPKGGSTCFS